MAFEPFEFTKNWENSMDFPTYEPDESRVRADLQWLHNEARDGLNRLITALNDPGAAAQLPFLPSGELKSKNIQAAIEEVYAEIRSAVAGKLPNGTVSKEKLTRELLERIYGGKVWVSLDTPGGEHNPETDFPVGQLWLRPGFIVDNLAKDSWNVSGWSAVAEGTDWVFTTDGTSEEATAVQVLEQVGRAGETVRVHLDVEERNERLVGLELYLNGVEFELEEGGVYETALDQTGSLEVMLRGVWYFAETGAVVRIGGLAVVNTGELDSRNAGCLPMTDWDGYLERHTPFEQVVMARTMWIQESPGLWAEVDRDVIPVERGGTGLWELVKGQMLVADGEHKWKTLDPPVEENCVLCFGGQEPHWKNQSQLSAMLGQLTLMSGSYKGTGAARTVTLPVTPKLLYLYSTNGAVQLSDTGARGVADQPVMLTDGSKAMGMMYANNQAGWTSVTLSGSTLTFAHVQFNSNAAGWYMNRSGVTYNWIALY